MKAIGHLLSLLCLSWNHVPSLAYVLHPIKRSNVPTTRLLESGSEVETPEKDGTKDAAPFTKPYWYAVEAFGKVFGSPSTSKDDAIVTVTDRPPTSVAETRQRIQKDNEREYFVSGDLDVLIYAEDCTFSDPFVSFQGRDRFVANLKNLSAFITNYSAKTLTYDVDGNSVTTKFMVKLKLNLPWNPVLAWAWGVRCEIDPTTYLIIRHEESVRVSRDF
jgi:hypothetical protein